MFRQLKFVLTDEHNADYQLLSDRLDDYYYERFGEVSLQYKPYNVDVGDVLIGYVNAAPVCCGALRMHDKKTAELKRVYVSPSCRRQGLARRVVAALEELAAHNGAHTILVETGAEMADATALYKSLGYSLIENFGPYAGDEMCVCLKKTL
ncbi:MAG: GNAT family N-acetyltransferase [Christensenellaceae bacterium]|jgi:putative acetyltransferase